MRRAPHAVTGENQSGYQSRVSPVESRQQRGSKQSYENDRQTVRCTFPGRMAGEADGLVPGDVSMSAPRVAKRRSHVAARGGGAARTEGETVVLRRYFFATPSTRRLGSLYFDVLVDPVDKIDQSTDHLRYRYVDFLTLPGATGVIDKDTNSADVEDIRKWLHQVRPRSRIEAYPQFVVCKEVLHRLLDGDVTFTNQLADQLRSEVEVAEKRMEQLRDTYASGEAVLEAEIAKVTEQIAALTADLEAIKEQSAREIADLNAQLQEARAHLTEAEAAKAALKARVDEMADELVAAGKKIASALSDCYQPEIMAEQLRKMMADHKVAEVLGMLSTEDKMQLFRQLMQTFDLDEKHEALKEVFDSFTTGQLDLSMVTANMRDPEKEAMLQMLLSEFKHNPQAVLKQLGGGKDAVLSDEERAKLESVGAGLVKQALAKGPSGTQQSLLDALDMDHMALVKALLDELGLEKFLQEMGIDAAAIIAKLGLVDPGANQAAQWIMPPMAPQSTQTDPADYNSTKSKAMQKTRQLSPVLHMFDNCPEFGGDAPTPKEAKAVLKMISSIYEDKVKADQVDDSKGNRRERMPEFLFDHLLNQYGLKALATKHLLELLQGVRKHSKKGTAEYNERICRFGELCGMLDVHSFSSVNVNFMMDFLKRLFVSDMIMESMNIDDCAVVLEQATAAAKDAWEEYSTDVPVGMLDELVKHGREGQVALEGGGTEILTLIQLDNLWNVVYAHWCSCAAEQDKRLLQIFAAFDEDHDGSLSLIEFKKVVNAVDFGTTGELPPDAVPIRDDREVVKMYNEAVEASKAEAQVDDQILPFGFMSVAYRNNLGVGIRPEIRDDLVENKEEAKELQQTQALGYTEDGKLLLSSSSRALKKGS